MMNLEPTQREDNQPTGMRGRGRNQRWRMPAVKRVEFEQWDFRYLARQAKGLYQTLTQLAALYAIGGTAYLAVFQPDMAMGFAAIAFPAWLVLEFWTRMGRRGMPAFALLVGTMTMLNSLPLLTNNSENQSVSNATLQVSAWTVGLYLLMLAGGWWLGLKTKVSQPSQWNLLPPGYTLAGSRGLIFGYALLGFFVTFQLLLYGGLIYQVLPGGLIGLLPILQACSSAAAMLGAFLGGLAVARDPWRGSSLLFWGLFTVAFFLGTSGIILSAASVLVIACAVGLGFRLRRPPWAFLIAAFLIVGFLNQGKFVMRERYWEQFGGQSQLSVSQLPKFYAEWTGVSLEMLQKNWFGSSVGQMVREKEGQSLVERLDNFRNLTFVVDALRRGNVQLLQGKTYTVIPGLLVPRIFWPDKPRTHEGQIILNMHFGRQADVEETYKTYIAWGLLPEAVGNFGYIGGAVFLGLFVGFLCGWLEAWSARKKLLSVEGLWVTGLLVQLGISYEMVASVFVTATFQMLVAVSLFGFVFHFWFKNSGPIRRRRPAFAPLGEKDQG